jgi:hypothetical protein
LVDGTVVVICVMIGSLIGEVCSRTGLVKSVCMD